MKNKRNNSYHNQQIKGIVSEFRSNPIAFLKANQYETSVLEYKSSFEFDTALNLCPFTKKDKNNLLNPELSLRIFETLVAFANTYGGLLIMGVEESKGRIVDDRQVFQCKKRFRNRLTNKTPCFNASYGVHGVEIGELVVQGIEKELSITGMDFDAFQRKILDRFALKADKKQIIFKPALYPCAPLSNNEQRAVIKISMTASLDQYIDEIFPLSISEKGSYQHTLGAITVKPAEKPLYITIDRNDSKTILHALPVRKTGKTELEKDLGRVETYISSRFGSALARQIAEELSGCLIKKSDEAPSSISKNELSDFIRKYSSIWKEAGLPYHMLEEYGKGIKPYTSDLALWEKENREEVLAFLFMVSLHFNTGWEKWTLKNGSNSIAVAGLFQAFHLNYWRTRFRALYALQYFNQELIYAEMEREVHSVISKKTKDIIKQYVPSKRVVSFIKSVADGDMGKISDKAKSVLMEIALLWKDNEAGMELPL